jgi:hypothetical protein
MTDKVKQLVEALTRKAKQSGVKSKRYKFSGGSSLHAIIRTPEQARRFMRNLKEAQQTNKEN